MNYFLRAAHCFPRVSKEVFFLPSFFCHFLELFADLFFFGEMKTGFCGATPRFLRVPRSGFNWRALGLFFGGGMSKTGNSRSGR